jgi:hypothetical protein
MDDFAHMQTEMQDLSIRVNPEVTEEVMHHVGKDLSLGKVLGA